MGAAQAGQWAMAEDIPHRPSLAPNNWGGWMLVALLWLLGQLPRGLGRALVWPLGPALYRLMGSRRRIARRNLEACFPEWGDAERERVLRQSFGSLARMLAEMAWSWAGGRHDTQAMTDIRGLEHVTTATAEGRGLLIVTAHLTCLEIGGRALGERVPFKAVYRPLRNEVLEWYQNRGRARYCLGMISKRELRGVIRHLRSGGVVWYAPDQDFGPLESVFAPFFGVETATLQATQRLPAMTGCAVVTMFPRFVARTGRYEVEVSPPLADFPGEDARADLARINAALEGQVRKAPEQYWWIHRRFKTRPEGEPPFYGASSRRSGGA